MANLLRATPHVTIPGLLVPQTQDAIWKNYLGAKLNYGEYKDDYAYIPTISAMASSIIDAKSEIDRGKLYHTQKFKFPFYGCVDRLVAISLAKSYTYDFASNEIKEVVIVDNINCNLIRKANKFKQGEKNEN
ncbi:hypothetical protein DD763_00070 [Helicobacter pylori]|uniref:hypothetical protein n=1 Tax=Helicobacter pylori TaxID=210 RepID=UPI000EADC712|nr:hypothetical protein [Helicobacter pylori]RKV42898.1 hypothetical protein DD763_00070 [Helicobacter pylori]